MTNQRMLHDKKKPGNRKAYVKPACISEKIFETSALACGKTPGRAGLCNSVPKRS